ncbi:MAG: hypothetical protein ACM3S4_07550 [Burkholderiales bacterium]
MEALKRSVMLLRPGDGRLIEPGRGGGSLKLLSKGRGVDISLKADCLKEGDFFLYLFTKDGKELYAGDVAGGALNNHLPNVALENIIGAAVVARDSGGAHSFCLKSSGPDWPALIERFKLRRAPRKANPAPHKEVYAPNKDLPQYTGYQHNPNRAPFDDYRIEAAHLRADIDYRPEAAASRDYPAYETVQNGYQQGAYAAPHADYEEEAYEPQADYRQENAPSADESYDETPAEPAEPQEGFEEESCDACPHAVRESNINPFPSVFPDSEWVKISYPGPTGWWHYISGKIYKNGALAAKVLGVPGEYGIAPPIWLEGFGTYLRCFTGDARGYWLMFQDAETGEVLDMGLSPHDG